MTHETILRLRKALNEYELENDDIHEILNELEKITNERNLLRSLLQKDRAHTAAFVRMLRDCYLDNAKMWNDFPRIAAKYEHTASTLHNIAMVIESGTNYNSSNWPPGRFETVNARLEIDETTLINIRTLRES